mmetsp:Transcript_20022/g.29684  ORF Transcript_20022/g.29684 Transcript_20022/m.29684 type:complete len:975 (-) Transcript_20022:56-2980(-)|eukprot:CAMPEP_0194255520 /NCGR_PEP_ID=MMETSP0158-20130606/34620_1 /TAXON_ID=33649 /ORGANISM="Thalassionema nitzschioides, Strain L26-B" /LENGTH=974 /DNA_ID=CAMNT_0038993895 /DNA_START=74 /DNA_END=2998 /DNA_ORIENTATION=-
MKQREIFIVSWLGVHLILSQYLATSFQIPSVVSSENKKHRLKHFGNLMVDNQDDEELHHLSPTSLLTKADDVLQHVFNFGKQGEASRRIFFAASLFSGGSLLSCVDEHHSVAMAMDNKVATATGNLEYKTSPVNKRSGVTIYDAERAGYNVKFVTYLSRFLLSFDADCQRWWYARASDLPRRSSAEDVSALRLQQFGAFSASVEVGLQEYRGTDGPRRLLNNLLARYSPDQEDLEKEREKEGLAPLSEQAKAKQLREIKEARRQIALLFGLLESSQPVDELSKLLAAIDNGSITSVEIVDPGSGYAPGYGVPSVKFPPPEAGEDFEPATGRAVLRPNGKILRVDLANRGFGYTKPPSVTISPPAAFSNEANTTDCTATAKAFLFRQGANKGRIERIQLVNSGDGYTEDEVIKITLSPPERALADGGVRATATAVLEYEVGSIQILSAGTGYATEMPINVYVDAPPLTARINLNDPMGARVIQPDAPIPAATLKKSSNSFFSSEVIEKQAVNDGKGGGGGCIGRACYDRPVAAISRPKSEVDSYKLFRGVDEAKKAADVEVALEKRSFETIVSQKKSKRKKSSVTGTSSGIDSELPSLPVFATGESPSSQLLSLLPEGIGLTYDKNSKRYKLAGGDDSPAWTQALASTKPLDPEYGPRGRSPIEREMELGLGTYLRFSTSGAICCSAVHLAVTPIDVVKTKVQTDPEKYSSVFGSFKKVIEEEGLNAFFTGWQPTFVGFFVWGGFTYAATEFLRRYFIKAAGDAASSNEVLIILLASGLSAFLGAYIISPFESVRIRSVSQPKYGKSAIDVAKRIVKEEGGPSLFSAVPAFWLKEIPFAMAKFTVFDISTAMMYEAYPAAKEDIQLSLLVSLIGGTLGGIVAAVVSNPADVTISSMKKTKSEMGPIEAATKIVDKGGPPALFRGLSLRMIFYALVVSLQFLVYDSVRFALGIGSDDLKLYLDVLGSVLTQKGGPV